MLQSIIVLHSKRHRIGIICIFRAQLSEPSQPDPTVPPPSSPNKYTCPQALDCATFPTVRTAIYPGSFDPLTNGHLDVIQRATKLFDRVVVAVARSESKTPLFSKEERMKMVNQSIKQMKSVEADWFDGLLVEYVEKMQAQAVVRGLRAVSDFEFEFQMALMNRKLNERIETIFMMPKDSYTFLSSRIVKEIARLGGDVGSFVPAHVREALAKKLAGKRRQK